MLAEVKKEVDIMVRAFSILLNRCLLTLHVEDTERAPKRSPSRRCCLAQNGDWHVRSLHSHGILSRQVSPQTLQTHLMWSSSNVGGGIIDMMNKRLRERLTEAEILHIFVDVCEGVAAMHNLRPPLLHRDLKVENILHASNNVFKLCDFGSATPVAPRPPSTTAEVRALEADLNKHTTLQYRAPEMVDPYLRRAVDEKSDVWALGVLLYKLCYYTTPFEEHGPLAILNVQYRIPPYPVYSSQMNTLIGVLSFTFNVYEYAELLRSLHASRVRRTETDGIRTSRSSARYTRD